MRIPETTVEGKAMKKLLGIEKVIRDLKEENRDLKWKLDTMYLLTDLMMTAVRDWAVKNGLSEDEQFDQGFSDRGGDAGDVLKEFRVPTEEAWADRMSGLFHLLKISE